MASFRSIFMRSGVYRALRHPNYASFALFSWCSTIALWIQRVCVQWIAWEIHQSFTILGLLSLADAISSVVSLPIGGTLADRVDRLRLAKITVTLSFITSASLAFVVWEGWITLPILLVLIVFNGLAQGLWTPVRMALVPNLVPKEDLPPALAVGATLFNLSQFIGPAVAGIIIVTFGPAMGVALAACLIMIFGLSLRRLKITADVGTNVTQKKSLRMIGDYLDAIKYVAGHKATALVLSLGAMGSFCLRSYRDLLAGYADGLFQAGAQGLALLTSVAGLSAFFGSFIISNLASTEGLGRLMFRLACVGAVFQCLFAFSPSFNLSIVAVAGMGFAAVSVGIIGQILVQSTVKSHLRGRVMSLWAIQLYAGPGLAAMLMGLLEVQFGIRYALAVITVFLTLFLLAVIRPNLKTIKELE